MRKSFFKLYSFTCIAIFMLNSVEIFAQTPCFDCTTDSIFKLIASARTPEDSLYAYEAYCNSYYISNDDDMKDVVEAIDKLIRLNNRLKMIKTEPYELFRDGALLWKKGEKAKSIETIKKAISELDKDKTIFSLISWLSILRILYQNAGMENERLTYYQEKLKYYRENGPEENIAVCYHAISGYYYHKADYNNTISYLLKAAEIFKTYSPRSYANEIAVTGSCYYDWGNYERAKYFLQIGYELNLEMKVFPVAMYALKPLALIEKNKKNYLGALKEIEKILWLFDKHPYCPTYLKAISLAEKGDLLFEMNKQDEAYLILNEAIALSDSLSMPIITNYGYFEGLFYLYKYYHKRGDDTMAEKELLSAYNEAIEVKHEGLILEYKKALADFYAETGRPEKAIPQALYYIKIKDSLREIQNGYNIADYETEQKDLAAYKEIQKQKLVRNGFVGGFAVVLLFAGVFFTQRNKIKKGKKRSDELLLNILPGEVAEELKEKGSAEARQFDEVTVMFTDFKGFTQISERLSPSELVAEIHTCFKAFDDIIGKHNIEKIKTIGDSYMCAGGLPVANKTNAIDMANAALEIQQFMQKHLLQRRIEGKETFEIRIGVHTGPVVAGIVGVKKFAYDIWGDTVNIASRMESSGEAGKVNISSSTYRFVKDKFACTYRGKIQAKNKGEIDMYFLERIS
jgi:class 3 adenylate cyclase